MPTVKPDHREAYAILEKKLREARRSARLTQAEAAKQLGKPQSFISKCESGERRLDIIELKQLAALYGKDIAFFTEDY